MKEKKGITLIILVITIGVILLVAGVTIYTGVGVIEQTKLTKFNAELKMIHARVNEILEEERPKAELDSLGTNLASLDEETLLKIQTAMQGEDTNGFRYFDSRYLETIGIYSVEREVLINFSTREVVDINGVKKGGNYIYRAEGWYNIS